MTRRGFLELLATGAMGAMVLDPEKLLWVPGAKTIFLPPVQPSYYLTVEMIAAEALAMLKDQLLFLQDRRPYPRLNPWGGRVGVGIRAPRQNEPMEAYRQDIVEPMMTCAKRLHDTRREAHYLVVDENYYADALVPSENLIHVEVV